MKYRFLRFNEGKTKAVTLSYDDGEKSDLKLAENIKKYNLKCTFNLTNDCFGQSYGVTPEEVKEFILGRGHEIAVHTATHKANGKLRPIAGIQEVLECRQELESKFNIIIRGMAYPDSGITHLGNGVRYEDVREYLGFLDIAYARTLAGDNNLFRLPTDWYAWVPTAHHNNQKIFDYINEFVEINPNDRYVSDRHPRMFYLWGHSNEFNIQNNWERLTQICEQLGNKEDTWYATNMEIYEYVKAYESLVFSVDETIVYNPTLFKIWFYQDDMTYCIEPGETIRIDNL